MIPFGNFRSVPFRTDNLCLVVFCTGKLCSKIAAVAQSAVAACLIFGYSGEETFARADGLSFAEERLTQAGASRSWNLSIAKGPQGETSAAIMHTADFDHSDPSLAGLMLRCANQGLDVILISLLPFPPKTHPQVVLQNKTQTVRLTGSVIPTGAGILVPITGEELSRGAWQESPELTVKILDGDTAIQGVVTLAGLPEAANHLESQCSKK